MTDIDWVNWIPQEMSSLCFIRDSFQVLLILKKRGFGAGKISAPGGHIETGETARDAAIRETQEEVGLTPWNPVEMGTLSYDFSNGYKLHATVFLAEQYEGKLISTDEADPIWTSIKEIPYHKMWEDDAYWLPSLLRNQKFIGYFHLNGDAIRNSQIYYEKI